jgi:hypothetical protein
MSIVSGNARVCLLMPNGICITASSRSGPAGTMDFEYSVFEYGLRGQRDSRRLRPADDEVAVGGLRAPVKSTDARKGRAIARVRLGIRDSGAELFRSVVRFELRYHLA